MAKQIKSIEPSTVLPTVVPTSTTTPAATAPTTPDPKTTFHTRASYLYNVSNLAAPQNDHLLHARVWMDNILPKGWMLKNLLEGNLTPFELTKISASISEVRHLYVQVLFESTAYYHLGPVKLGPRLATGVTVTTSTVTDSSTMSSDSIITDKTTVTLVERIGGAISYKPTQRYWKWLELSADIFIQPVLYGRGPTLLQVRPEIKVAWTFKLKNTPAALFAAWRVPIIFDLFGDKKSEKFDSNLFIGAALF